MKLQFSFLPIPEEMMKSQAISFGAKFLFGIMAKANKEKVRWGVKYLSERMGCSQRETRRRISELKENNLILVMPRSGRVNDYVINLELISIIQTPDQSVRGENSQGGADHSSQGRDDRGGQVYNKEHSLNKLNKEQYDFKNLKRLDDLKRKHQLKPMVNPLERTKVQEEVGAEVRPSGK